MTTRKNIFNSAFRNTEFFSNRLARNIFRPSSPVESRHVKLANLNGLTVGKFRHAVIFPFVSLASILRKHVAHVVGVGSDKKMGWIAASRIVALMENMKPVQNFSIGENPSNPTRCNVATIKPRLSVALIAYCSLIWPTLRVAAFFNSLPKGFSDSKSASPVSKIFGFGDYCFIHNRGMTNIQI